MSYAEVSPENTYEKPAIRRYFAPYSTTSASRLKIFIIALISILLIVTLGKISFAEVNDVRMIGDEYYPGKTGTGKIYIKYSDLKNKYKNY